METAALVKMTASLLGVVLILLAGAWLTRRLGGWKAPAKHCTLNILNARRLGGRSSIAIVEVENARLVIGISPNAIALLHTLPAASVQQPAGNERAADFHDALAKQLDTRHTAGNTQTTALQ